MVNTVHDSAITELYPDEHAEFMEASKWAFTICTYHYLKEVYDVEFNVPLGVGVTIGDVWSKGTEYEAAPMPPFKMEGVDYSPVTEGWKEK